MCSLKTLFPFRLEMEEKWTLLIFLLLIHEIIVPAEEFSLKLIAFSAVMVECNGGIRIDKA